MIRIIDIVLAIFGIVILSPILTVTFFLGLIDTGSPIFVQDRVGKNQRSFRLIKFRTMAKDTQSVASHLANKSSVTKLGNILRKTKIDELPQLINVLKGEMSLVGPRPNLLNQTELIKERQKLGVYDILPGITGLAQIQNIDMSTPKTLAQTDRQMIDTLNVRNYFQYIILTVMGSGSGDAMKPGK